jgi:protein-disulfide isomerase
VQYAPVQISNLFLNPIAVVKGLQYAQEVEYKKEQEKTQDKFEDILKKEKSQIFSETAPFFGNKDAKVQVVVFSDYRCGYCRALAEVIGNLMKEEKYNKNIKFIIRDYPILGPASGVLAIAALQSFALSPDKFLEVHEALYKTDGEEGAIIAKIKSITGKTINFSQIDAQKKAIETNLKLGNQIGIKGTPAIIIGDEFIGGLISEEELKSKLDAQIKAQK